MGTVAETCVGDVSRRVLRVPFVAGWDAERWERGCPELLVGYVALVALYSSFPREWPLHSFAVCSWQAVRLCTVFGGRLLVQGCIRARAASPGPLWIGDVRGNVLVEQRLFVSTKALEKGVSPSPGSDAGGCDEEIMSLPHSSLSGHWRDL